jgi:hypothetical protein
MGIKGEAGLSPRSPRQTSWLQFLSSLRPLRLCVRKARSLAKIAKTNLLASVSFFFAPFAALREDRPGSLAKIAKIAKKSLFCSLLRPYRISPLEPFLSAGRLIALPHATHKRGRRILIVLIAAGTG